MAEPDAKHLANADASSALGNLQVPPGFSGLSKDQRTKWMYSAVHRPDLPAGFLNGARRLYDGGNPAALRALREIAGSDLDLTVRRTAVASLARIPDPAVIPTMVTALSSLDRASQIHAILALGRHHAREGVPGLIGLLDDRHVRVDAARSLVAIRDERALEPLRTARKHGWFWQRRRLRECCRELESSLGY